MSKGSSFFRSGALTAFILITVILGSLFSVTGLAAEGAEGKVDLYITPETEHLPIGHLLSFLLESELGLKVDKNVQYSDVGLKKVVNKKGDLFIGLNLPPSEKVAWNYPLDRLCNLGPIYEDVMKGWAVPNYVAEEKLGSLVDLEDSEVKRRLHGEIVTYESKDNLVKLSREVIEDNEFLKAYRLVVLSEMVANQELDMTTMNDEWIVTTMKRPSVAYSLYDVRFINKLTDEQSVHLVGRSDLMAAFPSEVTEFLSRFYLPIDLVSELVLMHDRDPDAAAKKFIDNHDQLVKYWLEGVESL
jgi:glycine betaine/proline transport system substrate-binding protein